MLNSLEEYVASSATTEIMSIDLYIICILSAIVMGILLSYAIQFRSKISKSFAVTLALLPAVVCVVIMMVNGSIGAGIAVAGAFSLVRFRSVPGTAREITGVFIAMAIGLACGMGNVWYAAVFTVITIIALLILENTNFGVRKEETNEKVLKITIPEDLDYTEIFTDLFEQYTDSHKLTMVKTINLGSMFRLSDDIVLKDPYEEKEFIDKLRVRNGNYDAAVFDIMMPIKSGLEALKEIRNKGVEIPILLLTAKTEISDRVAGLDSGAVDYLTKPFAVDELLARIRTMTRRKSEGRADNHMVYGNVKLDLVNSEIITDTGAEFLGNKEFQMMEIFMNNKEQFISADRLFERIRGYDNEADMSVVWVNISNLRKKLRKLNANVEINAKRNTGYRLVMSHD